MNTRKINKFLCCFFLIQFSVFKLGAINIAKINLERVPGQDQGARRRVVLSEKNDLVDSIGPIANQKRSVMEEIERDSINWERITTGSDTEGEVELEAITTYNGTKKTTNRTKKLTDRPIDNYAKSPE